MIDFFKAYARMLFVFALTSALLGLPIWALWEVCSNVQGWPHIPLVVALCVLAGAALLVLALRVLWTLTSHLGSKLMSELEDWLL